MCFSLIEKLIRDGNRKTWTFFMYQFPNLSKLLIIFACLVFAGCGGAPTSDVVVDDANGDGSTDGDGTVADIISPTVVTIGNSNGDTFTAGEIGSSVNGTLSAGGSTELTVNFVNDANEPVISSIDVEFNSECVADGTATLSESTVTTVNGQVSVDYTAEGCVGTDTVTATAVFSDLTYQAVLDLSVQGEDVGSIAFVSASPEIIAIAGTGGTESSDLTFLVRGVSGSPLINQEVEFTLVTETGGLSLVNTSTISDSDGLVITTVLAGNISTPVRVNATVVDTDISTSSSELSVGTGFPDQNSMTLALTTFNPAGWEYAGVESTATVFMADIFNNPVPDGTAVSFRAEGGSIDSNCLTINGTCSVIWRSQNPRPTDGRVTILASVIGNESFTDNNGNGIYDDSDLFGVDTCTDSSDPVEGCDDLGEAYQDNNENGQRDDGEEFVDFNSNQTYDTADGLYNGLLCIDSNNGSCVGVPKTITVRKDTVLVMSSQDAGVDENGFLPGQEESIDATVTGSASFSLIFGDQNGNAMPIGTTIAVTTDATGSNFRLNDDTYTIGSAAGPTEISIITTSTFEDGLSRQMAFIDFEVTVPTPGGDIVYNLPSTIFYYWGN